MTTLDQISDIRRIIEKGNHLHKDCAKILLDAYLEAHGLLCGIALHCDGAEVDDERFAEALEAAVDYVMGEER